MKKVCLIFIFIICILCVNLSLNNNSAYAQTIDDIVNEQIDNIDFKDLEDYYNLNSMSGDDFFSVLKKLLKGEINFNYSSVLQYVLRIFFTDVYNSLPIFISIIALALFCAILQSSSAYTSGESVSNIVYWVCFLGVVLLLGTKLFELYNNTKNTIENMVKLTQIMSPIILTLMIAVGGNVSASMYSPAVTFLSNGIVNLILSIILPLVGMFAIFSVMSNFSKNIKLNKFADFSTSIIKWLIGISVTVFTVFISIQGITASAYDGISIKTAKYAISNTVPIIGGFISGGFDLVVAGSVLIKNAVGVTSVIALFGTLLSPVLELVSYSLLLKLTAAITEPISDSRISNVCVSLSKCISYFIAVVLMAGFMLFITILFMTLSVNGAV